MSRYWHASFDELPVGTVLTPRPEYESRWQSESVGRILEDLRPAECLPHRSAVFMCDSPQGCDDAGAHCEWLFEVEPSGAVERHDMEWATCMDRLLSEGWPSDGEEIRSLAHRYWQGHPSECPTWEYLAGSAIVIRVERY